MHRLPPDWDLEGLLGHRMQWNYPNLPQHATDYDAATGTHGNAADAVAVAGAGKHGRAAAKAAEDELRAPS